MFLESERQSLIKDNGAWIAVCGELRDNNVDKRNPSLG